MSMHSDIDKIFQAQDFTSHAWIALKKPLSIEFYKIWLKEQKHGSMQYLKEHLPLKEKPETLLPSGKAHSVFLITQNYLEVPDHENFPLKNNKVALYAQGIDYHHWLKDKLSTTVTELKKLYPNEEFLPLTDSSPFLERDYAYQAGLGWIGKNTCLISQEKGSLFFIGEILSTLKHNIDPKNIPTILAPDRCGNCTRCIDVCPTKALDDDKKLDARKCISYLTIEVKTPPPVELREGMQDWLFGCDLCQTVCPWNQKVFGKEIHLEKKEKSTELIEELRWILTTSNRQLMKELKETPLSRAGGRGLKRNAIVVATNLGITELEAEIQSLSNHEYFSELCTWSAQILKS